MLHDMMTAFGVCIVMGIITFFLDRTIGQIFFAVIALFIVGGGVIAFILSAHFHPEFFWVTLLTFGAMASTYFALEKFGVALGGLNVWQVLLPAAAYYFPTVFVHQQLDKGWYTLLTTALISVGLVTCCAWYKVWKDMKNASVEAKYAVSRAGGEMAS